MKTRHESLLNSIARAKRAETIEEYRDVLHDIQTHALNAVDKDWTMDAIFRIAQAAYLKS